VLIKPGEVSRSTSQSYAKPSTMKLVSVLVLALALFTSMALAEPGLRTMDVEGGGKPSPRNKPTRRPKPTRRYMTAMTRMSVKSVKSEKPNRKPSRYLSP
jgi:hypothetical protein